MALRGRWLSVKIVKRPQIILPIFIENRALFIHRTLDATLGGNGGSLVISLGAVSFRSEM